MANRQIECGTADGSQTLATRERTWNKKTRVAFLRALAETCNVRMACAIAGRATSGAYDLRRRDTAFREAWVEALSIGYERLEEALLRHALVGLNEIAIADDEGGAAIPAALAARTLSTADVQMMLGLLNRRRAMFAEGKAGAKGRRRATTEETDAALQAKLNQLATKLRQGGQG